MPNQRRIGQTFIGAQLDEQLLGAMDRARGFKDRSQFVREAIAEKLRAMKIPVPERLVHPPPRARIAQQMGGMEQSMSLNETPGGSLPPLPPPKPVRYGKPKRKPKP